MQAKISNWGEEKIHKMKFCQFSIFKMLARLHVEKMKDEECNISFISFPTNMSSHLSHSRICRNWKCMAFNFMSIIIAYIGKIVFDCAVYSYRWINSILHRKWFGFGVFSVICIECLVHINGNGEIQSLSSIFVCIFNMFL